VGKRLGKRSPNTMFYMYHCILGPPGAGKPHLQLLTWHLLSTLRPGSGNWKQEQSCVTGTLGILARQPLCC
jgi:hypothetical protein